MLDSDLASHLRAFAHSHGFINFPASLDWSAKAIRIPAPGEESKPRSSYTHIILPKPDGPIVNLYDQKAKRTATWHPGLAKGERSLEFDADAWAAMIAEEKAKRKEREKKEAAEAEAAYAELLAEYDAAFPVRADHEYIARKGIRPTAGVMQSGTDLLVPCRSIDAPTADELFSIERIRADGRKLAPKGRSTIGRYHRIGPPLSLTRPVYVVEGYATGATVHETTEATVLVAFDAGNLEYVVGKLAEAHRALEIVIAADDDHETTVNGEPYNTGRIVAGRVVSKFPNVRAIFPPWPDGVPIAGASDFNDIRGAVPERVLYDTLTAPPPVEPPEAVGSPETAEEGADDALDANAAARAERAAWMADDPFLPLGVLDGAHAVYAVRATGDTRTIPIGNHSKMQLVGLYPDVRWWAAKFPNSNGSGTDWMAAAAATVALAMSAERYDPTKVRGVGAWRETGDTLVVNYGDRLWSSDRDAYVDPFEYESRDGYVYTRGARRRYDVAVNAMTLDEASGIVEILRRFHWAQSYAPELVAGWIALAPVCGALPWRPHIWISGEAGAGKSTLGEEVIERLVPTAEVLQGRTTEAGIRRSIVDAAVPVILDEFEENAGRGRRSKTEATLELARSASRGGTIVMGAAGGGVQAFSVHNMFCFISIAPSVEEEADKTRITRLRLRAAKGDDRRRVWEEELAPALARLNRSNDDPGARLLARTLRFLADGRLIRSIDVFRDAVASTAANRRMGDQYGTLLAGYWLLVSDDVPTFEEAREIVASIVSATEIEEADGSEEEAEKLLRYLLGAEFEYDHEGRTHRPTLLYALAKAKTDRYGSEGRAIVEAMHGRGLSILRSGELAIALRGSRWLSEAMERSTRPAGWLEAIRGKYHEARVTKFGEAGSARAVVVPIGGDEEAVPDAE